MSELSAEGQRLVDEMSARHGFDADAVRTMLEAVARGGGGQAQFNHPAFGGMGQWSQGGMTMVGDMFNHGLKAQVNSLCSDLADGLRRATVFEPAAAQSQNQSQGGVFQGGGFSGSSLFVADPGAGWPADLGRPASEGAQNDMRYGYFPDKRRLAVSVGGKVRVYDTGDHRIGGFGQAQGGGQSLSFNSQHGLVRVADLKLVDDGGAAGMEVSGDNDVAAPTSFQGGAMPGGSSGGAEADNRSDSAALGGGTIPGDAAVDGVQGVGEGPGARPDARESAAMPGTPPEAPWPMAPHPAEMSDEQIFARLERLADFHARGILDDAEFVAKKAELLARL